MPVEEKLLDQDKDVVKDVLEASLVSILSKWIIICL